MEAVRHRIVRTLVLASRHVANAATEVLNIVADFLGVRRNMILASEIFRLR